MSSFLNDLSCLNFDVLEIIVNPDDALKYFYNCLNSLLMEHIPIKEKRVKKPKQPDWFNDEIKNAIYTRDQFKRSCNWNMYKIWRSKVTSLIKKKANEIFSTRPWRTDPTKKSYGKT